MAKANGPRKVRRYDNSFKVKVVKLRQLPGVQVKDVAASLDNHPFMLSKWRKKFRDGVLTTDDEAIIEIQSVAELKCSQQIKKEHVRLKQEYDSVKKPSGSVPNESGSLHLHRPGSEEVPGHPDVSIIQCHSRRLLRLAISFDQCTDSVGLAPGLPDQSPLYG